MSTGGDAIRFHQGLAAEDIAARAYMAQGAQVLGLRVRTSVGEIDLIVEVPGPVGPQVVFVEVKARRTHAAAAHSLGPRQQARLMAAAEVWLAESGRSALTLCRFDVVTVDSGGTIEILENALGQ